MNRRERRRDAGLTLIELLIVIVIVGVISLPLANLVFAGFKYFVRTNARYDDSHDLQITTAFFSQDVSNTGTRLYTSTTLAAGATQQSVWLGASPPASYCGQQAGRTLVLLLAWDTSSVTVSGGTQTLSREIDAAAYLLKGSTLIRVYCTGNPGPPASTNSPPGTTVVSTVTLAHNLYAAGTSVSCSSSCTSATLPASISLSLAVKAPTDTSSTTTTLTGEVRQQS